MGEIIFRIDVLMRSQLRSVAMTSCNHLGDLFQFDCEQNEIIIGSKSKGKLSPRSHSIEFERKRKHNFVNGCILTQGLLQYYGLRTDFNGVH